MIRQRLPRRFVLAVAGIAVISPASLVSTAAESATSGPIIFVAPTYTYIGGQVSVHGMGFAANEFASVAICGDGGLEGAQGCDLAGQATLITDNGGRFSVDLPVTMPPSPCPCVIEVDSSSTSLHSALAIAGAPTAPLKSPQQALGPHLRVVKARLNGYGDFLSWLGWPAKRTLELKVANTGSAPATSPVLSLEIKGWGRGTTTLSAPRVQTIPPGGSRTFNMPVDLGPVASGDYTVTGRVYEAGAISRFRANTFTVPWALLLLVLVGLQALLILARNKIRARIVGVEPEPSVVWALEEIGPKVPPVPVVVDITERAVQESLLEVPEPADVLPTRWATTSRVAVFVPEHRLTCSIERVSCPEVGLEKTSVVVLDDFAYAPWEALHEDVRWSALDSKSINGKRREVDCIHVEARGFALEVSLLRTRPVHAVEGYGMVQPVYAHGELSLGDDRFMLDCYTVLALTELELPEQESRTPYTKGAVSTSYGFSEDGGGFFLMTEAKNGGPPDLSGSIIKEGRLARIVEGRRAVEDRLGPYPHVVTVELRDSLGRTIECRGHARNGIGSRQGVEGLVLHSLVEWDLDGKVAIGEDDEWIGLQGWRSWRKARTQLILPGLSESGVGESGAGLLG